MGAFRVRRRGRRATLGGVLRLAKLTDYAMVLATRLALEPNAVHSTRSLGEATGLSASTVAKILKALSAARLVTSVRGKNGGYALAKPASRVTLADVIVAMEGPLALTECSSHERGPCDIEGACRIRRHWRRINVVVLEALRGVTIADLAKPLPEPCGAKSAPHLVLLRTARH